MAQCFSHVLVAPSLVISSRSLSQHGLQQEWDRRKFSQCQVRWCVRHLPLAGEEVIRCEYNSV